MEPKRKLKGMLARIFSNAEADEAERSELETFISSGEVSPADVEEVVADFVATTWKITMADGVVSDTERARLEAIVALLGLEADSLPAEWVKALERK